MSTITIDDAGCWIEATINGKAVQIDLAELQDQLWDIERAHRQDPWRCRNRDCGAEFVPTSEQQRTYDENEVIACPCCDLSYLPQVNGEQPIPATVPPQAFLDSVKRLLVERYGVPRLTRDGAGQFYAIVAEKLNELKKTTSTMHESPFGSVSHPEDGPPL